jgi:transcriptional regulator with XRE-family HTH domain
VIAQHKSAAMSNATDGPVARLVNEKWSEIGLSQADLAEVLGATFQQTSKDEAGSNRSGAGRVVQIAGALGVPAGRQAAEAARKKPELSTPQNISSLQSLLDLRLLRAFHEMRDHRTKRILVQLAERIVQRQANRRGDAG